MQKLCQGFSETMFFNRQHKTLAGIVLQS